MEVNAGSYPTHGPGPADASWGNNQGQLTLARTGVDGANLAQQGRAAKPPCDACRRVRTIAAMGWPHDVTAFVAITAATVAVVVATRGRLRFPAAV